MRRGLSLWFESLCVSPVFTDRAELFPPWAFVGVEVMGSTRTVQMLGPVLFGYWWSKCQCLWELSQLISFDFGLLLDLATKCFLFATMKNLTTKPKKKASNYNIISTCQPNLLHKTKYIYIYILEKCYIYNIFTTLS